MWLTLSYRERPPKCWILVDLNAIESDPSVQFSSVVHCVQLFATPWTEASQASLSITNSQSLLRLVSIESAMPSNHLILCHSFLLPSVFPSIRVSHLFASGGQTIGVSASASVLPMNIQDWFLLDWTDWISLLFKSISSSVLSFLYSSTLTPIHDYWKNHSMVF